MKLQELKCYTEIIVIDKNVLNKINYN